VLQLIVVINQDSADFDQLSAVANDLVIHTDNEEAGIQVSNMTMTDEFGNMVVRWETDKAIFILPDGTVKVQPKPV
jgi:hypothetical protein